MPPASTTGLGPIRSWMRPPTKVPTKSTPIVTINGERGLGAGPPHLFDERVDEDAPRVNGAERQLDEHGGTGQKPAPAGRVSIRCHHGTIRSWPA